MAFNLNTAIADVGATLAKAADMPGAPASVVKALADLNTAIDSIEAAVPDLVSYAAVEAINFGLQKVGLTALEPEIDALAAPALSAVENLIATKLGLSPLEPTPSKAPQPAKSDATTKEGVADTLDYGSV